jgi:hypothetical protein
MSHDSNHSGTITTGGVSQELIDFGAKNGFMLRNVSAGSLWVRMDGKAATADHFSLEIKAGEFYETPQSYRSTTCVNIIGATQGQAFFCEVF